MKTGEGAAALALRIDAGSDEIFQRDAYRFERRRAPRYETAGEATAQIIGPDGSRIAGVSLLDSSACGLALTTAGDVSEGDEIRVYFGGDPMPGRTGIVRRVCVEHSESGSVCRVGVDTGVLIAA